MEGLYGLRLICQLKVLTTLAKRKIYHCTQGLEEVAIGNFGQSGGKDDLANAEAYM